MNNMKKNHGIIRYKDVDFHFYIYGHRGGRGLAVYKEYLNDDDLKTIKQINKFTVNFASWHFEPEEEAKNIIRKNFNFLNN